MSRNAIIANTLLIMAMFALSVPAGQASTICAGSCPIEQPPQQPPPIEPPITVPFPIQRPWLLYSSSETSNGWSYYFEFGIFNSSPVNSFTLPYFTDEQISSVISPNGWSFKTSNIDIFSLGQGAGYMSWAYIGTPPNTVNPGFGFLSPWAPGLAPFNYTQIDTTPYAGVGINLPISPLAIIDGLIVTPTAIPVPPAVIQFLSALALLTFASGHRVTKVDGRKDWAKDYPKVLLSCSKNDRLSGIT